MKKGFFRIATPIVFVLFAAGIGVLVYYPPPWNVRRSESVQMQPRIVVPRASAVAAEGMDNRAELMAREDSLSARVPLSDGEVIVSVLTGYFDGGLVEKQFVAYRNLLEVENTIYLTFIDYDEATRSYNRVWSAKTAATRPGTVSLYAQDLIGDRSSCVLLHGMNGIGENTLTIFRKNPSAESSSREELFTKIAEFRVDGTITVREVTRTQAYQSGQSRGQSFTIAVVGGDMYSSNILDQLETVYSYNDTSGQYVQTSVTRIPGAQVEQRLVRELLGSRQAFETFVSGLWYHVTPQGTIDRNQYIFFSPQSREIIFYGDETLQVFIWQGSSITRYGLYVSSQNISVSTLRRTIDIELESLESIRVRINEDVRLNISVSAPWDGSYRKAGPLENRGQRSTAANTLIDAWYDGAMGKLHFLPDGSFELSSGGAVKQGKYAFFYLGAEELLELRPLEPRLTEFQPENYLSSNREVYLIDDGGNAVGSNALSNIADAGTDGPRKTLNLLRVMLGARGISRLNERAIALTLVENP
ncbi:MAG: pallilysin-related adhesin [Treponema sp.]|jgi:hypothetical protein|nr:pallilysin-related adhesin [Treponema sp.]